MRIWIDLTNSPHVNFFAGLIRRLEARGHELLLTARPHANTEELLRLQGLQFHSVGRHYGAGRTRKVAGLAIRCTQLARFLRGREIDVAISHSSFYSPVVARALGIRCIYLNDNEHAGGNHIAFRFADRVMVPEFLDTAKVIAQGARPDKILAYPGVKEGVYLWERASSKRAAGGGRPTVFVRPEPWVAQYYTGKRYFLDDLLLALSDDFDVFVLPRGEEQAAHYRSSTFAGIEVPRAPMSLEEIAGRCDLFIGAGGTMTREAAVLGIPTISIYQDELLDVDRFLIEKGCMVHLPQGDVHAVRRFYSQRQRREAEADLLSRGRSASEMIEAELVGAC